MPKVHHVVAAARVEHKQQANHPSHQTRRGVWSLFLASLSAPSAAGLFDIFGGANAILIEPIFHRVDTRWLLFFFGVPTYLAFVL